MSGHFRTGSFGPVALSLGGALEGDSSNVSSGRIYMSTLHAVLHFVAQTDSEQPARRAAEIASDAEPGTEGLVRTRQIGSWALQLALYGCLAAILYGAGTWGLGSLGGNSGGASKGKTYVISGMIGAVVVGIAATAVEQLYTVAVG